jgi:hypothetical protein
MYQLKPLHKDTVDAALAKAERYRLLNEPEEAESICLDVLEVDPANQTARIALLLSLTDQFGGDSLAYNRAREVVAGLSSEYDRAYYGGIAAERRAKAQFARHGAGTYDWLIEAMHLYERAEALRPQGNDDALLRWNTCVRFLTRYQQLRPASEERVEIEMLE